MASADVSLSSRPYFADPSAPDPVPAHTGNIAGAANEEFDDILNYDAQIDNVFQDVDGNIRRDHEVKGQVDPLQNVDEEVKVRKKRAPIAKLDEERLLGPNGIPKLRRITKERLRLKGKGHEFSDVARLLSLYQMWLDDLFPKANFADGLSIIEKLGHKRRMQVMRQEWIDESKPRPYPEVSNDDLRDDHQMSPMRNGLAVGAQWKDGQDADADAEEQPMEADDADGRDHDMEQHNAILQQRQSLEVDVPDADELDMLLAEHVPSRANEAKPTDSSSNAVQPQAADDFADDEEAMRELW